jgi:hypothetical protein
MHDPASLEAIQQIAQILSSAYLRLRFDGSLPQVVDSPKVKSESLVRRQTRCQQR